MTALPLALCLPAVAATAAPPAHWVPGAGDPAWAMWGLSLLSLAAAALCLRHAWRAPSPPAGYPIVWGALAVVLLGVLALTQAGLHGWLAQAGRELAQSQGWYAWRRALQAGVIAVLVLGGILLPRRVRLRLGRYWPECRLAVHAGTWLAVFLAVRAVSFHPVDALLRLRLGGLSTNAWAELAGVTCVLAGAWAASRRSPGRALSAPACRKPSRTD